MSKKKLILIGMVTGSFAGGYGTSALLGIDSLSFISLLGSAAGAIVGIWITAKYSQ